jgi:hypothetical protein
VDVNGVAGDRDVDGQVAQEAGVDALAVAVDGVAARPE